MPRARLLVIQHAPEAPPDWFGDWLTRADVDLDVLRADHGRAIPAQLTEHSGLLVLGGRMGALDDAEHRWLVPTRALVATTVAAGVPFLGICLGHQLAAVALGGAVERNPRGRTRGLVPFGPTAQAKNDALLGPVGAGTPVLHANEDVVTRLPSGAVRLAEAPDGTVQAARYGRRAWGLQFHPEASPETFAGWVRREERLATTPDHDGDLLVARVLGAEARLRRAWAPVARRFAQLLAPAPGLR